MYINNFLYFIKGKAMEKTPTQRHQGNQEMLSSLWEKDFSSRLIACLKNDGIQYIGQVVQMSETEFLHMPNFGRKSLNELKEFLATRDLHLLQNNGIKDQAINNTTNYEDLASAYNIQTQEKTMTEAPKSRYHGDPNMLLDIRDAIPHPLRTSTISGQIYFLGHLVNYAREELRSIGNTGTRREKLFEELMAQFDGYDFRDINDAPMDFKYECDDDFYHGNIWKNKAYHRLDQKIINDHVLRFRNEVAQHYGVHTNAKPTINIDDIKKNLKKYPKGSSAIFTKDDFNFASAEITQAGKLMYLSIEIPEILQNLIHDNYALMGEELEPTELEKKLNKNSKMDKKSILDATGASGFEIITPGTTINLYYEGEHLKI